MMSVKLTELSPIEDDKFLCAVIVARYNGKWIFVRQKMKETWELPGGTHEKGESIAETAYRELYEETGAVKFSLTPICITSVIMDSRQSYGMLFYSEVSELGSLPDSEIEEVKLFDGLPKKLTYPGIHDVVFQFILDYNTRL